MRIFQASAGNEAGHYALTRTEFQVLREVARRPCTLWDLLGAVDGTVRDIYTACSALRDRGALVYVEGRIRLGEIPEELGNAFCPDFESLLQEFELIRKEAPRPTTEFFQELITSRDVLNRVTFVWERGDLFARTLLVLGDDDLFSILAGLTRLPRKIIVGEIDRRWVEFISAQAEKYALPIEVREYNVADPLPRDWRHKFDVCVMDPVETRQGFLAWLSSATEALTHPGSIYFGLTELECSPKYWHEFQLALLNAGLVLTDIVRNHSRYENRSLESGDGWRQTRLAREAPFPLHPHEQTLWYRSSFCRAVTTKRPTSLRRGKIKFGRAFYKSPYVVTLQE